MVVVGEKNYKHIDEGPIRKRQKHNEEGDSEDEGELFLRLNSRFSNIKNYVLLKYFWNKGRII